MTIDALLTKIHAAGIRLRRDGGELAVSGGRETLASDPSLIGELRSHKAALLDLVGAGDGLRWWSPPAIRPEMLPLVAVTQAEIDGIVAGVPGGAANVQDIYPLAPLQEGILFHHLLAAEGDPYLLGRLTSFDSRERVDAYLAALRAVIARHDILRTSIAWEGLREPVQVVWREAPLAVDVVEMEPAEETVAQRLLARFDPRHHRLDVRRAPLMHAYVAHDPANERWLLLLQEHHLISDHTTVEVLLAEIGAHLLGRQDQLPSPLPFRNFVAQARLGVSRAEHEAFFTNLLGDVEEPTAPFGLLDAWGDGSGIAEAKLQVDADVAARMRGAARKLGVSVASIGHVACAQVLARVSGREDVVFGTVLVGRMQGGEGADRVLGPFINTLPVRVRVGADGAEATVRRTHGLLADLLRHEHASLALAQRSSGVRAPAPLFSALLNYRHSAGAGKAPSAEARPGWAGIQRLHAAERSNYPLTLSMDDVGDGFWLTAQLPASAGPQRVCEMMHLALAGLVEALDQAPGRALASIDVLPPAERTQVVEGWNDTDAEYPSASSIHRVFETWAERSPDAVAVVSDAGTLTYAELNGRANRLARHLVDRGVDAGARVAILMPRSAELLVSELAILKAGAAYVPIDPTFPAERIAFMVADSGARVVLSRTGEEIPALESVERIGVDSLGEAADGDAADLRASFGGDALAYVMYTSGSTGEPKGVMVPHRAIARLAINNGYVDFGPGDRVAFAANPTFDASTMEVWGPLLNGGSIVVIPQDVLLDPRRFGEALAASGVTVLWMTVGLFNQYADELKTELGALRHLVVGGDALDPAVIARVLETNPPARLTNGYGPTETTTFAVTHRIEHVAEGARSIPLGRPISNTRVYVLDGAGEPAPAGVAGELHIGGAGVARGYLNRPGLTAERFVPDPFSAEPGARLYRTGDRTRWLADGTVEYLGRTDQQVKVRGFRIEPGEVEARLAEHPSVREAVVMAREDVPGEKRLVAYTVGDEVDAETLRAHLSGNLPEYMIPAAFVRLDALPLTANGKVDRRALPAPDGTAYGARGYEAPATAMESALAGIWGEVLGVERVGRHDHFFDLGGHSLLAVQLISRARQVLGTEVALGELFARPVLADFARVLEDAARAELPPIEPVDRSQPLALSFAQQRLWLLEQIGGVGGTYHVPSRLRLHGEMDRDALARALERIVARHEMLRATFHLQDGAPVQRIVPVERSGFSLADHDLAGHRQQEAELRRLTAEEAAAPFQLERGPLIRGRLLRLGAEDHVLLITMHHIVSDGWSMGVFVRELSALYGAFRAGEPDPLPELQIQYADYAAWQRRRVSGDAQGEEAEYWRTALAGVPELLELPTDHVRPARQSHAGAGVQVLLDEALAAGLKELSRRHGTTLFMTLLAGWAAVLGRLAGQDDVVIGTPTANRDRREVESLIGFFVNTLALRVDLSRAPTVAELLGRVKARAVEAQHHTDIPFEQVVELMRPVRSLAHSPLFQVMFAWQNTPSGRLELPGLTFGALGAPPHLSAKYDLTLNLQEAGGRIVGVVEYATALFERTTVERQVRYLRRALEAMVADDAQAVQRIALLTPAERQHLVEAHNDTTTEYPADTCVHELFEAQAARTPDAVALVHDADELTFAELNARANRLAHHLRELGVGPDARVAIGVDHGVEMVVGLLAVLKAGGAYLPLDPAYPEARLRFMLEDAAPVLLLTQSSLADRFAGMGTPLLALDGDADAWAEMAETNPPRAGLTRDHLAYVIFTSGSTGTPKGALVPHGGLTHYAWWARTRYAAGAPLSFALYSSFAFDLTVTSIFVPLITGGAIVVYGEGEGADLPILRVFAEDRVDAVKLTPAHLALLDGSTQAGGRIRTLVVGGEDLGTGLARSRQDGSAAELVIYNEYGPTETVVGCAIHRFDPRRDLAASVPIGRPIANTRVYVLDAHGEPVPPGVVGELFVGGAQVTRGYLNRPALTAERFVADAFSTEPGARLYRTGDRARWRAEGRLEFLGRDDHQVKLRGYRIEPGEVEARLAEHPGVREALVVAREDVPGDRRLVAYFVGDETLEALALREHVAERLPEHMVPAAFVHLDALPLTPNGKVDRKALPAPDGASYATRGYEPPAGETEVALAEIWAELLGIERVGRWDDFFELGGHSLLAVQVVSRIGQAMGLEVGLGEVFERPVLADFARRVEGASSADLPPIERVERGDGLALSFAQQRLWFLEQLGGLGATYHMPSRLRMQGRLDRAALLGALQRIVERHEALRTVFDAVDGEPRQRVLPAEESRFLLADHDLAARIDAEAELARLMAEEAAAPFDLARGPLIRGRLVRLAEKDHVLLVTMHHIVSDGWSMGLFAQELSALYGAFCRGDADPLPALKIQYADYAAWQRRWVSGEVLQEQAEYWDTTLAGAPELLELPADGVRPAQQDFAGATAQVELNEALTAALHALGRRHGTTLFMTLLAGWSAVLARLAGQADVVIGTPSANRGRAEVEGLIGFFVNTLAVRLDLGGAVTVGELLAQVKARTLAAQQHQDIPFEQVVERLQPVRSMAHSPLFQVLFAWQNASTTRLELPGLTVGSVQGEAEVAAKFDLMLSLQETGGRVMGGITYATALYSRETVERQLGYLRRVLEQMADDDRQPVRRLALLPPAERRLLLEGWNDTAAEYPAASPVHAVFAARAERTPDAVAVVAEGETLTYAELDRRANRLAWHLKDRGVDAGARVAILMPRSLELLVSELAILKAGAAYVPIDPTFPAERVAFMLADSGSRVVLSRSGEEIPAPGGAERIDVDAIPAGDESDPRISLGADALAYVMYTSGSTGEPKGVMVPHRAITRLVLNAGYVDFTPEDRVAFGANPTFDASTMEVWGPLLNGGRVVVIPQDVLLDPRRFGEALTHDGVSVLWMTVGLFNQYADELKAELGALRHLVVGGDALDPAVIARVLDRHPPEHLTNGYGPTETTTFAVTHRIERVAGARSIPLGRPISNTRVYVLADGEPVPTGVAGELHIGGAGVAHGYLNRPGLTAERFVPDPFSAQPGARLYRTGDRTRWLADGTVEYLGRTDQQVKVRGFRIEPGEVEARLAEHPSVREAAVLAREDVPGEKRLVAYYVGEEIDGPALRAHLSERLPEYMLPSAFVRLDALPLTPNGKLDRRALPAPDASLYLARGYEPPAGEMEAALAELWSDVLGIEQVGRHDDFFDLGGHSLLAVRLISRVRQVLGVEVALGDLFVHPVLADFAKALEHAARAELPAIEPADRAGPLALSFAQQRLWFLERLGGLGSTYHVPSRLRLQGALDRDALGRALDRIVARHEALRTVFHVGEGEPEQVIAPVEESRFLLQEHDLAGLDDADAELGRLVAEEAGTLFDLARGPLIRGRLIRLAQDDHVLLVTMHHVVSDAWSMGVLVREMSALYAAFRRGEGDPLPALPVQYADYAAWQRRWVSGDVLQGQADYWTETLAGAPELLELPADRPRPTHQDHAGARVALELDEALTAGLKALGRRHGTTLYMTLLAGWAAVLGRLSGQEDVVIGTPSANRGRAEIEGLIGFFINTFALRLDLSGSPTPAELLGRVKARALGAQQNPDIPFEQVVERVQPGRSLSHTPLFQVLFTWQNAPLGRLELPGLTLGAVQGEAQGAAKFDLALSMGESAGRITGSVTYATALFDRETVERYGGYLRRVLEAFVSEENEPLAALELMSGEERRQVVEGWNDVGPGHPADACIHELFEAQVARTPEASAVVFDGRHLAYGELNRRANRLAHQLREFGVGPETRVALCLDRGPEMMIGLLGVLKAGGAYVPMDPAYPLDRLTYMLEDSKPLVMLTQTSLAGLFTDTDLRVVNLQVGVATWLHRPDTDTGREGIGLRTDHPAYVIYTSGSTGQPKGVVVEHRQLAAYTRAVAERLGVEPGMRHALVSTPAADLGNTVIFPALCTGGTLHVLPHDTATSPDRFSAYMAENEVDVLKIVPSHLAALLAGSAGAAGLPRRRLVLGGEASQRAWVRDLAQRAPGMEVVIHYGPTETTVGVLTNLAGDDEPALGTVPLGRPLGGSRVYVLDRDGRVVPPGAPGELHVGGAQVARGYLNRPGLTAERFVPDPFSAEPGARLYRTGDRARWRPDGRIEFLGRTDFQVKIRGYRVELGEIESALAEHAGVREAVVSAREDVPGDLRLVAYYLADGQIDAQALRTHLAERLPDHMLPSAYVRMERLPLTPNGKVDRRALPEPDGAAYATSGHEAPVGETEEALAEIWSDLLGIEAVGRWDNFFELGGHSLLAVQIISRVGQVLGMDMVLGDVFERPVLADFARSLQSAAHAALPPIEPVARGEALPLSFGQQRLWFLEQLGGMGSTFHLQRRLRLEGDLDRAALVRALERIVARHEVLRTTFTVVESEPWQRVAPADGAGVHLLDHDLSRRAAAETELARMMADDAEAGFDLEHGPLFRAQLIRLAPHDHMLLVTMHHIVSDGWSTGVFFRELSVLYGAFRRGEADPLPPLGIQYADYAAWQRRWVTGDVLRQQAEYWTETLAGVPELLELPADRPRPLHQDHDGGGIAIQLDEALSAGLKGLSRRNGTTLFMTLLAGWSVVLSRLSGQTDLVIGTPTADRGRSEVEGLIGFFVNTLALRLDLSGSPSVVELLNRVKARALGAQQHQDIPFEQVVDLVQPARSLAHSPLFQVMFAWQNTPGGRPELPGLKMGSVGAGTYTTAEFDLILSLQEAGGRIRGGAEFATALYDRETVERHFGYLRQVLEGMVADEHGAVQRLALLPAAERAQVVEGWNDTAAEYPGDPCVHELFEAQVARTPDAPAVVSAGRALTYAELNRRANQVAHHLRSLGVEPDARVAVCMERGVEMVVGLLGILKAGGAYVPLDPAYPVERLRHMLGDSAPVAALTQSALAGLFAGADLPLVEMDAGASAWSAAPETNPERGGLTSRHLAYVIYTSGSTGKPKGVAIAHRNTANFLAWGRASFERDVLDRTLFTTSLNFDLAVFECFVPLTVGASVHVYRDALALADAEADVTLINTVPSAMKALVDSGSVPPSVHTVNMAGEPLKQALVDRIFATTDVQRVCNLYGPSETTTYSTWVEMRRGDGFAPHIGRPIANTQVYILDAAGEPMPVGVAGELCIGGAGVARGYLNRPALTADRFVPDPFASEPGERLYRTGDLARWLPAGTIEFLGRNDHQVKVRGFRIELGEIEARLAEHADVRESVVVSREDVPGDTRLVAYFVGDEALDAQVLRSHLAERLPEHMVPAAFVRLDAMPLTQNGKLDRKALPSPEGDAFVTRGYEPPVGEAEEALAGIWAELLGVERVGRWDNYFELGGHSLRAVQLISRVRQVMGMDVALGEVFERPVLADFARTLQGGALAALPAIEPADRTQPLALSFAQQRLWFLDQLGGLGTTYHIPTRLRLHGALDRDALRRALDGIVARHETLRTVFHLADGEPEQRITSAEKSGFELVEHDLAGHAEADAELRRLMTDEATAPFDLARGPLIRGRLIALSDDDHVLLVTLHHIVSDGWSMGVLVHELSALYGAFSRGEASPLPALPVQYADYAAWQRRWVTGDVLRQQSDYWTATLADAPALLELPADRARPALQSFDGALANVVLDEALTAALKALSRRHGTTLFMTLLAGWAAVLGRLSGQTDLVVGTPSANRGRAEIEGMIGFFINTLALRLDLSGSPTVGELLGRTRARALEAQQHQDIPFEQVVDLVQPTRSLAHSPLFQVMFTWQNAATERLELPGLTVGSVGPVAHTTARFDLSLALGEAGGRIVGAVAYATALFDAGTVERHLGYLRRVLEEMVADDARPVERLALLPPAERAQVVEAWNATDAEYPRELCVHELVEAQAARTPDAVALVFAGDTLSYAALNARANKLAHHLRTLGVGPDARVAICVERGLEMVVGLLGVLKSGGAYVPLDPAYPVDRLRFMLEDSAPAAVLTQASLGGSLDGLFTGADVPVLDLDTDGAGEWSTAPETNPDRGGLTPEHLAYVIYTSGSTGRPKGVAIAHRNTTNFLAWGRESFDRDVLDRTLFTTSLNFDLAVFECFVPLTVGASVHIVRDALALATSDVEVTLINTVPSAMKALVDSGSVPRGVHTVNMAGEPLKQALVERIFATTDVQRVCNLYGPSETTTYSTWVEMRRGEGFAPHVGRPIHNTRVYVLDARGEPVPVGVAGELCIGGEGVARGYLNRPALTADRFVPNPFSAQPGARLYRTGDLARWRPGGTIDFLGRNDHQVKVRGFRIELGEIEARLAEHPGVREAVVMAREDVPGDTRLVAYYVGDDAQDAQSLRTHLSERLPEYMLPAAFVWLEALPLTPNGKLDRKALPSPEGGAFVTRGYEAPLGEREEALAAIWSELLGVDRVGRWDNYFELGGHSLRAVQLVSRVRQALGMDVALGEVFERPVLADFARGMDAAALAQLPAIEPADRDGRLALSFAQQRLWFIEQLGGLGGAYHIPSRLRLRGTLDRDALVRALDRIVERHEALRTVFHLVDGEPEQRIVSVERSSFHLLEHDLAGDADAKAEVRRILDAEATSPFALQHGPMIRGRLVALADDDHVLLVTMHHIVSDGWSMGVFVHELSALYGAFSRGEPDPLPALPLQYADYAAWQRRWVTGDVLQAQTDYWVRTLAGVPELLELPLDHPRPPKQDFAGAVAAVELDEALSDGLRALSRRNGTTLFMTLLAGWAAVMGRLSGQTDVVIGTPTANRGRTEVEGMIGFFINTLALRLDLSGSPTVAELLGRTRVRALEAQHHQDIPFEQVVELVQPARSLSHTPLFQVMFAWQNAPAGTLELPGLTLGPVPGESQAAAKFDLSLSMGESAGRIAGSLTYATTLFERDTVGRYVGYLRRALEEMVADDRQPVERLAIVSGAERRQVVEAWNDTAAEYPADVCIHALFEAQAERAPGATAIVSINGEVTYAEMNARANRLAHHLRTLGVGPDARVAICVERGPEMIVGMLAVLKAGGAYVPMDPAYPVDRLRWMLDDSAPAAVLTQASLGGSLDGLFTGADVPVLDLDTDGAGEWASAPETNPSPDGLTAAHLAYVIYTSGSTGRPKGVAVAHRSLSNLVAWHRTAFGVEAGQRSSSVAGVGFDAAAWEIWPTLCAGAALLLPADARDPEALLGWWASQPLDVGFLPTPVAELAFARGAINPHLKTLLVGGDRLRHVPADLGSLTLVNNYGPTETTVVATSGVVEPGGAPHIGRPIANTRVYLVDGVGQPVPLGAAGELFVGGAGVARGYLGQPGMTAERFVPDPFSGDPGARLYRTGDRARWLADGTLDFLGRADQQVKVRGFRIELGEIEARLAEHASVREAVVAAREDGPGDTRLVAYYVGDGEIDAQALRAHLSDRLPDYMLPAAFVALDGLPLTPNGKLDRTALPAPEGDAYATRGYEAPVGETEVALAAIWAETLGVERVGRWDNFFELGGHSLRAVQIGSRVRQVLGVDVALGDLFVRPALADFARGIEGAARTELPAIEPVARGEGVALSFAQQRLWFLEQLGGIGATYNIPTRLRLRGELDRGALLRALERIVARHEALRTTFHLVDGEPEQRMSAAGAIDFLLVEHDVSGAADALAEVRRLMAEEGAAPFDLEHGPLIRGRLVRLADDDHVLLVTMHHIVSDGWSMGVFIHELGTLYRAFSLGQPDPLPEMDIQYADYAAWQRRWVSGEVLRRQTEYWKEALAGAPELLELPADHARPAQQAFAGAVSPLVLGPELTAGLKALAQRHGTTLYMTLLAGWATVLGRLSRQTDVVIGTPTANRGRAEVEGLIGFFVNTLAVRVDLSGSPSVADVLERVKAGALGAQQNQDIPFEQVVELMRPVRSRAYTPLFQVMFTLQNAPGGSLELPGLTLAPVGRSGDATAKFDLSLTLAERDGRIVGGVEYATSLFEGATVARYLGYLHTLFEAMVADEEQSVDRLPLMDSEERRQALEPWSDDVEISL